MAIVKARRKNPEVLAVQWTMTNLHELQEFAGQLIDPPTTNNENQLSVYDQLLHAWLPVSVGQYVVKDVQSSFFGVVTENELEFING